jgi:hypothetical protein
MSKLTYTTILSQKSHINPNKTLSKFEQKFERRIKQPLEQWIEQATLTSQPNEDHIEYIKGHYRLYQDAYDQVWLFQRISTNE